jgi:hypothetical protein
MAFQETFLSHVDHKRLLYDLQPAVIAGVVGIHDPSQDHHEQRLLEYLGQFHCWSAAILDLNKGCLLRLHLILDFVRLRNQQRMPNESSKH